MAEPDSARLTGALDRVLEKGVVVDVQARISLVGIDIMRVEGQVVAADGTLTFRGAALSGMTSQGTRTTPIRFRRR
jgi:hypothetical protein